MTPLIVVNDQGLPVLVTGGSGGINILSSVISVRHFMTVLISNLKFVEMLQTNQLTYI